MKVERLCLATYLALIAAGAAAQTNTFPQSGNVGIGTLNPVTALNVNGGDIGLGTGNRLVSTSTTNGNPNLNYIQLYDANGGMNFFTYYGLNTPSQGYFNFYAGSSSSPTMTINSSGAVGIGTSTPQARLYLVDGVGFAANASSTSPFGDANVVIESSYGYRAPGTGASLNFAFAANTDGTNIWDQARILATPDNSNTGDASGRMYLQTRYSVSGSWAWRNNVILTSDGATTFGGNVGVGGTITFPDGYTQTTAWRGVLSGADYAESVDVTGDRAKYEPGDVLVIVPGAARSFRKTADPYSKLVAGIYSTKPGVLGKQETTDDAQLKEEVPMAMVGIVPTKVSAENGPIQAGDLLVTATLPGYAMKGTDQTKMLGAVLGKALGALDSGTGKIEVLVTLQ